MQLTGVQLPSDDWSALTRTGAYLGLPGDKSVLLPDTQDSPSLSLQDLLIGYRKRLPPASDCHLLLERFYTCSLCSIVARSRMMPRSCIQKAYDTLWSSEDDQDRSESAETARKANLQTLSSSNSLSFLAMLFADLAVAYTISPGSVANKNNLAMQMYETSRRALSDSETREDPNYCIVVTLLSQTVWVLFVNSFSVSHAYVARAILHAQAMVSSYFYLYNPLPLATELIIQIYLGRACIGNLKCV